MLRAIRAKTAALLLVLFLISVVVRRPLFNHELTASWEWLAAHTLLTMQLWERTPVDVHHFNLLYTFPPPPNKFIDDLWRSGVADQAGNYYYVSMPHLAFFTPYAFLRLAHARATIESLQIFALCLHFCVAFLLYLLARSLTFRSRLSRTASVAAFCVFVFAPTPLFFYQNAVVGTVLVIPYTIVTLWCVTRLLREATQGRRAVWVLLFLTLLLGCLTDWQAYFTALAAMLYALWESRRPSQQRAALLGIAAECCAAVTCAIALLLLMDSRIAGLGPFASAILGRFKVRIGAGDTGLGLNTLGYYRNMARFYSAYLPFLLLSAGVGWTAWRRSRERAVAAMRPARAAFAISTLALLMDHLILANHTSQQNFTTLNSLVPIGIFAAFCAAAFFETSTRVGADRAWFATGLAACVAISIVGYYYAYRDRPHPFRAAAAEMTAHAAPNDVFFATGAGFEMPDAYMIPQMLFYARHNIKVVKSRDEAARFLTARHFGHGVLAYVTEDYAVTKIEQVTPTIGSARP